MSARRSVVLLATVAVLATGPACAKKNEDKLKLENTLDKSAHVSGVFRYVDETPTTPIATGVTSSVRGLVEDDFRYKARLALNSEDVLDEVVNDDALAVRFLDPKFIANFTGRGGDAATRAALNARYWVEDPTGAPPIGDAAVTDNVIGLDPIVDSLSVVDYVKDAIAQSAGVSKFNPEQIDYRPAEDPFPQPQPGSGVIRWDLAPPKLPRADALDTGQGAALAKAAVFRKMSIYVKDGRVVQIREQIGAKFDLLNQFRGYIERLVKQAGPKVEASVKAQIKSVENNPITLEALLNIALNQALTAAGQDAVRFHSMSYEFTRQGEKVHADLPAGPDVKQGALDFFGVNAAVKSAQQTNTGGGATTTTSTTSP